MKFGDVYESNQGGYSIVKIYVGVMPVHVSITECNKKMYLTKPEVISCVYMFVVHPTIEKIKGKLVKGDCLQSTSDMLLGEPICNVGEALNLYLIKRSLTKGTMNIIEDIGEYVRGVFAETYKDYVNYKKGCYYETKTGEFYTCIGFKDMGGTFERVPTFKTPQGALTKIFVPDMFYPDEKGYIGADSYTDYLDYAQLKEKYKDYEWYL